MPRTHASLPRLYVEHPLGEGEAITLGKEQSNYLAAVLRKRVGEEVILFNGLDGAWLARVTDSNKKAVALELVEQTAEQTPRSDLWLGFAPLKTARLDYVIQKATEMGAGIIQPVITQFTQVNRIKVDQMLANAVEAAEQCEVLTVPEIGPEVTLDVLVQNWTSLHPSRVLLVADEGQSSASPVSKINALMGSSIGTLIGPEGGFSARERALLLAQPFVVPISLGPRILRADTAAVAALAIIQATIGDWR
jgi:16S rRNA (uracil1498-N3)-methyltransferase